MSSALFGILQLDKGEPLGYAHIAGLIQSWFQDAGGFAMVGLVVYLLYAMATPTDKSESERIRVPVSKFMVGCAALALVGFAAYFALFFIKSPTLFGMPIATPEPPLPLPGMPVVVPPPAFHTELQPLIMFFAGIFALLGIGEPFARDMVKICRRNLSLRFSGVRRFASSVGTYFGSLLTMRRVVVLGIALGVYALLGIVVYEFLPNLFGIYLGVCVVALTVFVLGLLAMMLFEAEGPVWAIAKLSFKEAVRSQLLWVFLLIFLPFLFPSSWFRSFKPSDELRITVDKIGTWLSLLVLFPSLLLASFGIPNDIKNLNIYTVVSKPIDRFEVVLGRFVGYVSLMSLVLIALTGVSLVMVMNSSISEKARDETYKARVPVRGTLEFQSVIAQLRQDKTEFTGTNVGREFDYRKYIDGHPNSLKRGIWSFSKLPGDMATAEGDRVPVEFTFDIFKLTKGEQNKGAGVSFRFVTHNARQQQPTSTTIGEWPWADRDREKAYQAAFKALSDRGMDPLSARPGTPAWDEVNKLAEEFGCYEIRDKQVFDYQVMGVDIPAGLFRNAAKGDPGKDEAGKPRPRLQIYVKCETPGQLLGMAAPDLYLLEYEQPFALNYIKGMIGVWCWLCIIVGLAVACSTYLSGVLSLLVVVVLFGAGFFTDFIRDLANNRTVGGGPLESMSRLIKAEQPTAPRGDSAGTKALVIADNVVSWLVRRIKNVIPDLDSSDWSDFVSEGYNINTEYLVVSLLVTLGYLIPWAILAYYLMKTREVAA
jgi:hypothetical protein